MNAIEIVSRSEIKVIFLVALLLGCQNNKQEESEVDTSGFSLVSIVTDNEEVQNTLLDHGIDLFFSEVIAYEDQIYIASRGGKLLSMTMDGKVNWSLERPGRGPGEFRDPHDMLITDDLIGILDTERAIVLLFTTEGDFYKSIQLRGSTDQFGLVNGEIHIYYPYDREYLFSKYDIETGEENKYGKKNLIPQEFISANYMLNHHLLLTDDRYTVLALAYFAQIIIYDRELDTITRMDLTEEKEVAASIKNFNEWAKQYPEGMAVQPHFLDLVKVGDYFGVSVGGGGGLNKDFANFYRFTPDGKIHDKVYKILKGGYKFGNMDNLSSLSDSTYFGHVHSQDRLIIVTISDVKQSEY